jgi:hypothetical protein
VRAAGHGASSNLERIAGYVKLVERLDEGHWGAVNPTQMTELAAAIAAESTLNLGASRFIEHDLLKPLREWDARHWGTYDPAG